MSTKFKVGDKVFSASHGWGVVMDIEGGGEYPVTVKSLADDSDLSVYTKDGRFYTGKGAPVSLFLENEVPEFYQEKCVNMNKCKVGEIYIEENDNCWVVRAKEKRGVSWALFTLKKDSLQWERFGFLSSRLGFNLDNDGKIIFGDDQHIEFTVIHKILLDAENNKRSSQKPPNFNCVVLSNEEYARLLSIESHVEELVKAIAE